MCNVWRLGASESSELSFSEGSRLLEQLSELGTRALTLSGGEPMLRKDIFDIVQKAKEEGLRVQLITNGALMTEASAKRLVEAGLDGITFSVDGPEPAVHDEIRGVEGTWERAVEGIRHINKARQKKVKPHVSLFCVVTSSNYRLLVRMADLRKKLGYDTIHFLPPILKTARAKSLLLTKISLDDFEANYLPLIQANIMRLGLSQSSFDSLNSLCKNRESTYAGKYALPGRSQALCFQPWHMATVDPFGNVYPCCYACTFQNLSEDLTHGFWGKADFTMGNLRKNTFKEIWNGEIFRKFREQCKTQPLRFPICAHCDYEWKYDLYLTALFKKRRLLSRALQQLFVNEVKNLANKILFPALE